MGSEMARAPNSTAKRTRVKAEPAPTTPDPIEIAMEAETKDASPDSPARRVLRKQEMLIGADLKLRSRQIASEDLSIALKLLTAAAGIAVAVALGLMIWSASRADGLVIEAFSVPPALAERGITGETLARQLMDDLAAISDVAQSSEQQRGLSGDWGQAISIQIPQTGVSLAQMNAWLRETLGHQSHVSGEVMAAPDGTLTLVARSGSRGLPALTGQEAGVATLIQRTAEAVYAREQPRSMGLYLVRQQRHEEANAWYRGRTNQPAPRDRASSYLGQAWYAHGTKGDLAFVPLAWKSIAADPTFSNPSAQLAGFESGFGHIESAYQLLRRAGMLAARDTAYVPQWRREQTMRIGSQVAASVGDWREARARTRKNLGKHFLGDGSTGNAGPSAAMARTSAAMHDIRQAHADLAAYDAVTSDDLNKYRLATLHVRVSAQDWTGAIVAADAVLADQELRPDKGVNRPIPRAHKAEALAHLGRMAEAQALVGTTPLDCQPCVMARGEIAALAGQPSLADHWFGEAVKMTPSLPMASTAWGRVLLDRGQTDRAIAQFEVANTRGPHFADPLS